MLIKTTNACGRGCNHCLEDSTPAGAHMTAATFEAALDFSARTEAAAWKLGVLPRILLSGGECTEHPDIVAYIERVYARGMLPTLISNGVWLGDPERRAAILRPEWKTLFVQVTYDARYYPAPPPPRVDDPRLAYVDSLTKLTPLGRLARKKGERALPTLGAPGSFNLRSAARSLGSFAAAVCMLRLRTAAGKSGHCIPSVSDDGTVTAGESRNCWTLGTVWSTEAELTRAILAMGSCNHCGLEDGLNREQKHAIGI